MLYLRFRKVLCQGHGVRTVFLGLVFLLVLLLVLGLLLVIIVQDIIHEILHLLFKEVHDCYCI